MLTTLMLIWRAKILILAVLIALAAIKFADAAVKDSKWIVDAKSNCGTSNQFFDPAEHIRWYGDCKDGKLHGKGVLVWYKGARETQRNEGAFRKGEFHGEVVTNLAEGQVIVGNYIDGVRHGEFTIIRNNGQHQRAIYRKGRLTSQKSMSEPDIAAWKISRGNGAIDAEQARNQEIAQRRARQRMKQQAPAPIEVVRARPEPLPEPIFIEQRPELRMPATPIAPQAAPPVFSPVPPLVPLWSASDHTGKIYDMNIFLNERHPFASTPDGRSAFPKIAPQLPMLFATRGRASTAAANPGSLLANGWRDTPPPAPAAIQTTNITPFLSNPATLADSLFTRAYRAERAGDFVGAEALYERIIVKHPSAPSARLANDRLNGLRTRVTVRPASIIQPQPQAIAPPTSTEYIVIGDDKRVITVNSPVPARNLRPDGTSQAGISQIYNSELLNKRVCSRKELYEDGANWCGMVRRDDGSHLVIEVRDVNLKSFGQIGIGRSTCTGGTFLNWFSKGTTLRVPRNCMDFKG